MIVPNLESRFSLAAEGFCSCIPELKWEILAGYVLFDHSDAGNANGSNGASAMANFKQEVKLSDKEELLLLEVLNAAVKLSLSNVSSEKSKKLTKAQRVAEQDSLETGGRHLAILIPRLLNKFGDIPEAASAILKLEHVLSPENQDATAYSNLLEDIKKQFQSHIKPRVLEEASRALLHARSGDTEEAAQGKVSSLAEDAVDKITALAKGRRLDVRGSLEETTWRY